jgi:hypothetical protein
MNENKNDDDRADSFAGSVGRTIRNLSLEVRQLLLFPAGLRITEPDEVPGLAPDLEPPAPVDRRRAQEELALSNNLIAQTVLGMWRAWAPTRDLDVDVLPREARSAFRRLDRAWTQVEELGIQVQDHTRARYVSGMDVKVVEFVPTQGVNTEVVTRTLKPTIYRGDVKIMRGEVLVAIPISGAGSDKQPGPSAPDTEVNPPGEARQEEPQEPEVGSQDNEQEPPVDSSPAEKKTEESA